MWENFREKIVAILTANTLIQQIYDYEAAEFSGDPACTVVPSSNESDYRNTTQNRRVYAFQVRIWVKRSEPRTDEQADDVLTDLVDSVIDDFDKYYTFGSGSPGNALSLPVGYTMIKVEALPAQWGYANRETLYRVAELTIRCHVDVDLNLIS